MTLSLCLHISNVILGGILFGWAAFDAARAKTAPGRIWNLLLVVEALSSIAVGLFELASTAPA